MNLDTKMDPNDNRVGPGPSVFLAYSRADSGTAREFYKLLQLDGFRPWLDEVCLVAGQDWQIEIETAVRRTEVVAIFLSQRSMDSRGYVHKELALALDIAEREPETSIFIIPIRLDEVEVPSRLKHLHWLELRNSPEEVGRTYLHLQRALVMRADQLGRAIPPSLTLYDMWGTAKLDFIVKQGLLKMPVVIWRGGSYLVRGRNPSGESYAGIASLKIQGDSAFMKVKIWTHLLEYSGQYDGQMLSLSGAHTVTYDTRSSDGVLRGSWGEGGFEELIPASPFAKLDEVMEEASNSGPQAGG
jgi:hypothetical protein